MSAPPFLAAQCTTGHRQRRGPEAPAGRELSCCRRSTSASPSPVKHAAGTGGEVGGQREHHPAIPVRAFHSADDSPRFVRLERNRGGGWHDHYGARRRTHERAGHATAKRGPDLAPPTRAHDEQLGVVRPGDLEQLRRRLARGQTYRRPPRELLPLDQRAKPSERSGPRDARDAFAGRRPSRLPDVGEHHRGTRSRASRAATTAAPSPPWDRSMPQTIALLKRTSVWLEQARCRRSPTWGLATIPAPDTAPRCVASLQRDAGQTPVRLRLRPAPSRHGESRGIAAAPASSQERSPPGGGRRRVRVRIVAAMARHAPDSGTTRGGHRQ